MRRAPFVMLFALLACKTSQTVAPPPAEAKPPPVDTSALPLPPGIDLAVMDLQANPCDDFYRYACGGWMDHTEIPADRDRFSRGFIAIQARNEEILHQILEEAAAGKPITETPYAKQLGDFYGTCMEEAKLEGARAELAPELQEVSNLKDAKALARAIGRLHARGVEALFRFGSTPDAKDSSRMIAEVHQGGYTLPDRDYYVKEDEKSKAIRADFRAHLENMFKLLGDAPAKAAQSAAAVLEIETALAKAAAPRVELRDPQKTYNRLERVGLEKAAPAFPWGDFLAAVGSPSVKEINVTHPPFVEELGKVVKATRPPAWKAYLTWRIVEASIPALPKAFQEADFRFNAKAFSGAPMDKPRWRKCVALTDDLLGEALGQVFVARTFGPEGKAITSAMVSEIEKAFERNLSGLSWMDGPTRERALVKIRKMSNKIGFPDQWRTYEVATDRKAFLGNLRRATAHEVSWDLAKIGKPVDRNEWHMTPPTVNAYNNGNLNEIVFPAGILQPPFYDRRATDAVNLGAMGMVVGHEVTHGFDDEGRQFDADGNLKDWWTEASGKAFVQRAECVKNQFDQEVAIDDLRVNGGLTLGENVADLGGLKLAHAAMLEWNQRKGEAPSARYNASQQFFIGYAQSWCSKYRPEVARMRVLTDPHSPPFLRVNVPLSNLPEFRKAFQCQEGTRMARAQRCEVW